MLLVNCKLGQSGVHGTGVFAVEAIKKGTDVWRFEEGFDLEKTVEEVEALPEVARNWFNRFGYLDHRLNKWILSFDDARFINHSEDPNVKPDYEKHRCAIGVACRDIAEGEELHINYRDVEKFSYLDRK